MLVFVCEFCLKHSITGKILQQWIFYLFEYNLKVTIRESYLVITDVVSHSWWTGILCGFLLAKLAFLYKNLLQ